MPEFRNEEEEARFWDEHDSMEFIEDLEPVEIELSPKLEYEILSKRELKKPVTLRLEPSQIDAACDGGQTPYGRFWETDRVPGTEGRQAFQIFRALYLVKIVWLFPILAQ